MKKTRLIGLCLLALAPIAAGCGALQSQSIVTAHATGEHRVAVLHPEQWPIGEYQNCYLMMPDEFVHKDLPMLDCDLYSLKQSAPMLPYNRMFVMDVKFSGEYKPPQTLENTRRGLDLPKE